jgi:hypothetical protein
MWSLRNTMEASLVVIVRQEPGPQMRSMMRVYLVVVQQEPEHQYPKKSMMQAYLVVVSLERGQPPSDEEHDTSLPHRRVTRTRTPPSEGEHDGGLLAAGQEVPFLDLMSLTNQNSAQAPSQSIPSHPSTGQN